MKYYIYRHKLPLILSGLAYCVSAVLWVSFAFYLGDMINYILSGNTEALYLVTMKITIVIILNLLMLIIATNLKRIFIEKVMIHVKKDISSKLFRIGYAQFENEDQAYYMNLLTNDMNILDEDYLKYITLISMYVSQFVIATCSLFTINIVLAISFILLLLLPILVPLLFSKLLQRNKRKLSESNERYTFCVKELIEGYECILTNNIVSKLKERFVRDTRSRESARRITTSLEMNSFNTSGMLGAISQMLCFFIGGLLVIQGELSVGLLMAAVQLLNFIVNPIASFSEVMTYVKGAKPILQKLDRFLHLDEENDCDQKAILLNDHWNLAYHDVSFGYGDKDIISNFTDTFEEGKKYAIVGTSGCGKSTITRLLMQYYHNYRGEIMIAGNLASTLKKADIYDLISVVHQNTFIFNDTILNNITMYHSYDEELIQEVIHKVNLEAMVREHGTETIGDFGKSISGGEKQRIAIARALLKKSKVIIFDEACASLDPNNAQMIHDLIFDLKDILCIVITHDWTPSLMNRFDRVIQLDNAFAM